MPCPGSATARLRPRLARVLAAALEVAPRHHGLAGVIAPAVLDVAVIRALAGHLAQVPADAGEDVAHRHARPAPSYSNCSSRVNRPDGARMCDSAAGTSVLGSSSGERMALM